MKKVLILAEKYEYAKILADRLNIIPIGWQFVHYEHDLMGVRGSLLLLTKGWWKAKFLKLAVTSVIKRQIADTYGTTVFEIPLSQIEERR